MKSKGTMADKFMYICNDDTQNYPFCRLHLVVEMNLAKVSNSDVIIIKKLTNNSIHCT